MSILELKKKKIQYEKSQIFNKDSFPGFFTSKHPVHLSQEYHDVKSLT